MSSNLTDKATLGMKIVWVIMYYCVSMTELFSATFRIKKSHIKIWTQSLSPISDNYKSRESWDCK